VTGLLLECFPDERLPNKSVGRYPNGNFVLTRVEGDWKGPATPSPAPIKFSRIAANYSQPGWDISFLNGGNPAKGWAVNGPERRELCQAMFVLDQPLQSDAESVLTLRFHHEAIGGHNIGRFRISASGRGGELLSIDGASQQVPDEVRQIVALDPAARTAAQTETLTKLFRERVSNPVSDAEKTLAAARKRVADYEGRLPTAMVMKEVAPRLARRPAAPPRRGAERSLGLRQMGRRPWQPADRSRVGQPDVGTTLRHRVGEDDRELRFASRIPKPPRTARLVGGRIHVAPALAAGLRGRCRELGHEVDHQADRDQRHLSPIRRRLAAGPGP
jgi:hypothetical protein